MQKRNGFLTGLEGLPSILSSNLGKIRLFTTGPATDGVQGAIPGEVVLAEVVNRSVKRLVQNDLTQFFSKVRCFRVEKNGDDNYALWSYDAGGGSVTQVGFLKPFSSIVGNQAQGTVGALATMASLNTYLPNSARLWGTGTGNKSLDGDYGANDACHGFRIEVGVSSQEDPFTEGQISDAFVNTTSFGVAASPRLTIAGQGIQATFISNLSVSLGGKMQLELKDMAMTTDASFGVGPSCSLSLSNVYVPKLVLATADTPRYMRGDLQTSGSRYTFAGDSAIKMTAGGLGFFKYVGGAFQETAFMGYSTAQNSDGTGLQDPVYGAPKSPNAPNQLF